MHPRAQSRFASLTLTGAVVAAITLASCGLDPVHTAAVNALGGELAGVPQGEYHRAGQPCTTCHGPLGPAQTTFTMAGTIFYGPTKAIGVDNVQVLMVDSLNSNYTAYTNCVGNFFVTAQQWNPAFPVLVQIASNGALAQMQSHIGRETSCSNCHKDPPYYDSQGHIHLVLQAVEDQNLYTPPACPVNPVQTGAIAP
jgi:hypothetical protein